MMRSTPDHGRPAALLTTLAAALVAVLACTMPARAQDFPSKPIRLVVPVAPGGPTDILGRLVGGEMARPLGQSVLVDNRAGGDGAIGTDFVAKSPPDGHTVCFCTTGAVVVLPILEPNLPYDAFRDLAPVGQVFRAVSVILARRDLPSSTIAELIALARAQPGKLSYGTAGKGSPQHIQGETLKRLANLDVLHVPFKSAQQALNEVMGGRVDYQVGTVLITDPAYKAGKVKVLAVTGPTRWSKWLEVPTVNESGLPEFESSDTIVGLHVAAKTPASVIEKLHAALVLSLRSPAVAERFTGAGVVAVGSRPEAYGNYLVKERERFAQVVKQLGITRE